MPEAGGAPKLPILRSIIKDCLKWRPPVPAGRQNHAHAEPSSAADVFWGVGREQDDICVG